MNYKPIIAIFQPSPGQFKAVSELSDNDTAHILINLALNFIRQDERKKILNNNDNTIINPHTGMPLPGKLSKN